MEWGVRAGRLEELPERARRDPMAPPREPVAVRCLHCGREYSSSEIVWFYGLWCCPWEGCGGTGFLFDLVPRGDRPKIGQRVRKSDGR